MHMPHMRPVYVHDNTARILEHARADICSTLFQSHGNPRMNNHTNPITAAAASRDPHPPGYYITDTQIPSKAPTPAPTPHYSFLFYHTGYKAWGFSKRLGVIPFVIASGPTGVGTCVGKFGYGCQCRCECECIY
jgi:hypothetical protein